MRSSHHTLKAWSFGFAGGVVVGLLIGWLLLESDGADPPLERSDDRAAAPRTSEPVLRVRGPATQSASSAIAEAADAPTPLPHAPKAPVGEEAGTFVRVVLGGASDTNARAGTAYALPAGARGGRTGEDLPHATAEDEFLIPITEPGAYDVGYCIGERSVLETNVGVDQGKTTIVHLTVPRRVHIEVTWPEGPPPPDHRVNFSTRMVGSDLSPRPGRNERVLWAWSWNLKPSGPNAVRYVHVPPNSAVAVNATLTVKRGQRYTTSLTHTLELEPKTVRAGDVVRLVAHEKARLLLPLDPRPPPQHVVKVILKLVFEQGGRTRTLDWRLPVDGEPVDEEGAAPTIWGRPGPARLSWTGPGLRPGTLEGLVLRADRPLRRLLPILPSASWPEVHRLASAAWKKSRRHVPDRISAVRVEGLDATAPGENAPAVLMVRPDGQGNVFEVEREAAQLDVGWREGYAAMAFDGPWRASERVELRPEGATSVRLQPAGLLALVPERMPPENAGGLRLQREDGTPIPFYWLDMGDQPRGNPTEAESRLAVWPGRIVGPFPAGEVRFRVYLGRALRGEIRATVRAGKITPLVVRW